MAAGAAAALLCASGQAHAGDAAKRPLRAQPLAEVSAARHHDLSPPLWLLPPATEARPREDSAPKRLPRPRPGLQVEDGALQEPAPPLLMPTPLLNFDGMGNGFTGPGGSFLLNSAPPDTNGDVGPNHFVETVNSEFAIFNKSGTAVYGPLALNTLWSGFGGGCQTNNDGDPIVIYDPIANRWVISQFSVSGANGTTVPFLECVAVSQTSDPTGAYYRYAFPYTAFNDYPKFGVWPDGYYVSFNMFNAAGTAFLGSKVCAYDRAKMMLGQAATQQCFNTSTSFGGLLPSDLDGARLPPAGAPNPSVALGSVANQLAVWMFHVDWTTPASSTFTGPTTLATAAFTEACGGGTCIPQTGTTVTLDSLADRLMYRVAYRNFGDHQALVVNHSVTAGGGGTGVRWYEIRLAGGVPSIFQQGTYAPDTSFRWMGSMAMDQVGNMGLGFSTSSAALHPEIRATGRLVGDPAGQMSQGEVLLLSGAGSQTGGLTRWGDYSMMAVDPTDDCTFWFVSEYLPANGSFNWRTRAATFKFPDCAPPDFSIAAAPVGATVALGGSTSPTISTAVVTGSTETVALSVTGAPAGVTTGFSPTSVTTGGSSTLSITVSAATVPGVYPLTVTGTSPSATHSTGFELTVASGAGPFVSINSVSAAELSENHWLTFQATLSAPSAQTVTVSYATADNTAVVGSDYLARSGTLTFSPGVTSANAKVRIVGDLVHESDQSFFVNLSAPVHASLGTAQGVGTILDDDPTVPTVTASINDVSVSEGNTGTKDAVFTVTLSSASLQTLGVSWATAPASATGGVDYATRSGTMSFAPGQTTRTITVTVQCDKTHEPDETYAVDLSSPLGITIADGHGVGTITNDDPQPTISIADPPSLTEGDSGGTSLTFTVTLSRKTDDTVTVHYATSNHSALAPGDYTAKSQTLTFVPGQLTKTLTISVRGDLVPELTENFYVDLDTPTNATINDGHAVGTILDNDPS